MYPRVASRWSYGSASAMCAALRLVRCTVSSTHVTVNNTESHVVNSARPRPAVRQCDCRLRPLALPVPAKHSEDVVAKGDHVQVLNFYGCVSKTHK